MTDLLDMISGDDLMVFFASTTAVMVMLVTANHFVGPTERRLILEAGRLRAAIDTDLAVLPEAQSGKIALPVGQP